MTLKDDWRDVVRKAWSVKFMVLAFVLTMAEVMLPFFSDAVPPRTFAVLSGLAVAGAFVTRLVQGLTDMAQRHH
jgi:hypothetical protein